ncbi:hypothetical protein CVS47_00895 [Microbacterium lemovicicum]|uniref:N-acetyltransferase domain-containing protein n=1 Tax=Microbacterium lemovicicum TaxID=1072463 RepID=A0A3S9W8G4_9MICO|nr:GNAT family N-acetyltransferase [Microbacterium lemovicicum]AZS36294.1 hypothetical protein CVS47_00895 [Microbacterium lemovicicum]
MPLTLLAPAEVGSLRDFLAESDLTIAGLDAPSVRLWVERGADGTITGSTGYELSHDGSHALIRSVAVIPGRRHGGSGTRLATHALTRAAAEGAHRAWLFSRRSGSFWQSLGFSPADRGDLIRVLADAHQVRLFQETGQLDQEVAWSRPLARSSA